MTLAEVNRRMAQRLLLLLGVGVGTLLSAWWVFFLCLLIVIVATTRDALHMSEERVERRVSEHRHSEHRYYYPDIEPPGGRSHDHTGFFPE